MSKSKILTEEERETSGWTLAVITCSVLVIWAASGWLVSSTKDPGQFGDMFGAVNALFSGLAFATLIYTVFLQRRELQLQREELAATRIELQRTASAQEASEAALRAQAEASAQSANLAAVNSLLAIYREAIGEFKQRTKMLEPNLEPKIEYLEQRQAALLAILEESYQRVTKEHVARCQASGTTPPPEK